MKKTSEERLDPLIELIDNSIRPHCVLPTLVTQKSEQKSIEEQGDENF